MSVTVNYASTATVTEALAVGPGTANPDSPATNITHSGFNTSKTLNGASTPPATKVAAFNKALATGAGTIDLTSLPGTNGAVVTMLGLKVQVMKIIAKSTNANPITLTFGASNPYELLGSTFVITLLPGQEVTIYGNDATPDVGSGAKNIDLAGTGSQSVDVIIIAG